MCGIGRAPWGGTCTLWPVMAGLCRALRGRGQKEVIAAGLSKQEGRAIPSDFKVSRSLDTRQKWAYSQQKEMPCPDKRGFWHTLKCLN